MESFVWVAILILFVLQIIILTRVDKVTYLERRVMNLEVELRRLKKTGVAPAQQEPAPQAAPQAYVAEPAAQAAPQAYVAEPAPQAAPHAAPQAAPKKNIESKIGKTLMAVLASILIFFSFILFAGIAFRYMTDTVKVLIMLVVSVIIAAVGIIKMPPKDAEFNQRYGTFFTALAACGVGAVYITALVAYFGFHCIDLIPFIVCIVLWIIVMLVLSYKRSPIFSYICNVGLIIATFMTAIQFESSLVAFILYTICLMALYLINRHSNFNRDCIYFIQYPIVFIGLTAAVKPDFVGYLVFAALLCGVFALGNLLYKLEDKHMAAGVVTILLNCASVLRILISEDTNRIAYFSIALMAAFLVLYFIRYYREKRPLFYIMFVCAYGISTIALFLTDMHVVLAMTPFLIFLALGLLLKDFVMRVGGYIALFVSFMIHLDFYNDWAILIIYFALIMIAIVAMVIVDYNLADKYILTLMVVVYSIGLIVSQKPDICIRFAIFAVLSLFMNSKLYHISVKNREREVSSVALGYVANGIVMFCGLVLIFSSTLTGDMYQWIIIGLMMLALACLHVEKLFEVGLPEVLVGFYLCIKFSILIYAVLYRLQTESFLISIIGILIAITCIVLGFMRSHKSFRLYGLIVSLVSVVKLILFDIQYDSDILRPVGFFIAGVLCFAISFIYSKIEKNYGLSKMDEKEL